MRFPDSALHWEKYRQTYTSLAAQSFSTQKQWTSELHPSK